MPTFNAELTQNCARCAQPIPAGALECPQCRTLVHSDQMEQLAAHARSLEAYGDLAGAHERWQACLPLLPPGSAQAQWIREHIGELEARKAANQTMPGSRPKPDWVQRLGPLGPVLLALWKFKPLLSFLAFFGFYWQIWGLQFGAGFAALIMIHEMGHFIDIKRRGLPADMPMFVPGLGAYVRWNALGVPQVARSAVSLAGPLAGWFSAAICAVLWYQTGYGLWAALARVGAWFNILNLTPLWIFDGSNAIRALSKAERVILLAVSATLGYALWEWVFGLVAIGTVVRLFTHDAPEEPSPSMAAYFVAVVTALALVLYLLPGRGNGL